MGLAPSGTVGYRVPDDQAVIQAARAVFDDQPVIRTQHRLATLVRDRLQARRPDARVGEARVRRLVVDEGIARVQVTTGSTSRPPPEACPVCGAEVEAKRNKTLDGGQTVVGTACTRCPYSSGARLEVPLLYEFVREDDGEQGIEVKGPF